MEFSAWIACIVLVLVIAFLLIFTLIREGQHQRIVRDLTAKVLARDLGEYKQVAECLPKKVREIKEKEPKRRHKVLGEFY